MSQHTMDFKYLKENSNIKKYYWYKFKFPLANTLHMRHNSPVSKYPMTMITSCFNIDMSK